MSTSAEDVAKKAILDVFTAEGYGSFVDDAKLKAWAKFIVERLRHAGKIKP